jgi:hypothetical protein
MIYLIQYDRGAGKLIELEEFPASDKQRAEEARLNMELLLLRSNIFHEVVLLEATNQEELRKTHRRYFERLDQFMVPALAVTS